MDKQKAYSTHEIAKAKNALYYLLRGIGMALKRYAILLVTTQKFTLKF